MWETTLFGIFWGLRIKTNNVRTGFFVLLFLSNANHHHPAGHRIASYELLLPRGCVFLVSSAACISRRSYFDSCSVCDLLNGFDLYGSYLPPPRDRYALRHARSRHRAVYLSRGFFLRFLLKGIHRARRNHRLDLNSICSDASDGQDPLARKVLASTSAGSLGPAGTSVLSSGNLTKSELTRLRSSFD